MSTKLRNTKLTLMAFISYIVITIILASVLMSVWLANQDVQGLEPVQIQALANTSSTIAFASALIGSITGLFISLVLANKTQDLQFKPVIYLAVILTIYSILSIYLHPEHSTFHQILKLFVPSLVCFISIKLVVKQSVKKCWTSANN